MGNIVSILNTEDELASRQPEEHEDGELGSTGPEWGYFSEREETNLLLAACSNTYARFVRTSLYLELESVMLNTSIRGATLIGNTGDGKTVAAKALAWTLYQQHGYLPVEVRTIQDIKEIFNSDKKTLFLVDDPFGAYSVYSEFVKDWAVRLGELDKYLECGNIKILVTTRTTIWEECKFHLKRLPPFDTVINMSSCRLSTTDRRMILKSHLSSINIDTESWEWKWKIDTISCTGSTFGFPACCKLATDRPELLEDIVSFFEKPFAFIRNELRSITANRPQLYSVLVLLMLNNGAFRLADLDPQHPVFSAKLQLKTRDIYLVCGMDRNKADPTPTQVRRTLEILEGTFLLKDRDNYMFSHESVLQAVALEFGQLSPHVLLRYADPELVVKTVQVTTCGEINQKRSNVIAVRRDMYPQLAAIITQELRKGHTELVLSNPCWLEPDFYDIWEKYVLTEKNVDDFLLASGSRWQRTIVHYAARKGLLQMVKFFNAFLPVDITTLKDEDGITVLHSAANGGHRNVVDYLLKQGFDPNVQENAGWTPLYVAVLCGHVDVVRLLLLAKADPNICTIYGSSPMYIAALCRHWHLAPLLRSWGARPIEEIQSPEHPKCDLVSLLIENDGSLVAALLRAVRAGDLEDIMSLLECGLSVNDSNACGWTSLYVSAVCGRGDIASFLLHKGANPQMATIYGRTPSYVADICGHKDIVQMIDSFECGLVAV